MSQWTENIKFHFTFSLSKKAHFENLLLIPQCANRIHIMTLTVSTLRFSSESVAMFTQHILFHLC